MNYLAILIDGDVENSLGGACSRDVWNISKKILTDLPIDPSNIFTFFHNPTRDIYVEKIKNLGITHIDYSTTATIKNCFNYVVTLSNVQSLSIVFHYSGHGYQVNDVDHDEIDGLDEIFLGHTMTDDFIWANLIEKLSSRTRIISLIDACHSGSGMDFPYIWRNNKWILCKNKNVFAKCIGYSLSACNDNQLASQDVGETTGFSGSLTAGICDCGNFVDMFECPFNIYNLLIPRLKKLNQTVELYCTKS